MPKLTKIPSNTRAKIRQELKARMELEFECKKLAFEYGELHDICQDNSPSQIAREYGLTPYYVQSIRKSAVDSRKISQNLRMRILQRLHRARTAKQRMHELQAEYTELMGERRDYDVEKIAERYGVSRTFVVTVENARIAWNPLT